MKTLPAPDSAVQRKYTVIQKKTSDTLTYRDKGIKMNTNKLLSIEKTIFILEMAKHLIGSNVLIRSIMKVEVTAIVLFTIRFLHLLFSAIIIKGLD